MPVMRVMRHGVVCRLPVQPGDRRASPAVFLTPAEAGQLLRSGARGPKGPRSNQVRIAAEPRDAGLGGSRDVRLPASVPSPRVRGGIDLDTWMNAALLRQQPPPQPPVSACAAAVTCSPKRHCCHTLCGGDARSQARPMGQDHRERCVRVHRSQHHDHEVWPTAGVHVVSACCGLNTPCGGSRSATRSSSRPTRLPASACTT
jgi:hypothetical protein